MSLTGLKLSQINGTQEPLKDTDLFYYVTQSILDEATARTEAILTEKAERIAAVNAEVLSEDNAVA